MTKLGLRVPNACLPSLFVVNSNLLIRILGRDPDIELRIQAEVEVEPEVCYLEAVDREVGGLGVVYKVEDSPEDGNEDEQGKKEGEYARYEPTTVVGHLGLVYSQRQKIIIPVGV